MEDFERRAQEIQAIIIVFTIFIVIIGYWVFVPSYTSGSSFNQLALAPGSHLRYVLCPTRTGALLCSHATSLCPLNSNQVLELWGLGPASGLP